MSSSPPTPSAADDRRETASGVGPTADHAPAIPPPQRSWLRMVILAFVLACFWLLLLASPAQGWLQQ